MKSIRRLWLTLTLWAIFGIALCGTFFAHEKPFARDWFCGLVSRCPDIPNSDALAKILYDLSIGALISLMFYLLLVKIPEWNRRKRLKKSLRKHYNAFKSDMISTIVGVADGSYDLDMVEQLCDQKAFREYFKEKVTQDQDRWDRFANNLEDVHIQELLTSMEIFRDEIKYILNATDIADDDSFEFFKRLSAAIYAQKDVTPDYDPVKRLSRFLWSLFAGWDWVSGYRERDIVAEMIKAI